jgi:hypothetical protein
MGDAWVTSWLKAFNWVQPNKLPIHLLAHKHVGVCFLHLQPLPRTHPRPTYQRSLDLLTFAPASKHSGAWYDQVP